MAETDLIAPTVTVGERNMVIVRRVLALPLTGEGEKEITAALSLGLGMVHGHITTSRRKFGVRGRAEVMALWL